jgi:ribonucleotide monophosphatase NagD (HAD superfamily)
MRIPLQRVCWTIGMVAALVTANITPGFAQARGGWVRVVTDGQDKTWYVDNGSIQGKGRFRYFWSYTTGGTPYQEAGKPAYSTAFYLWADCQQQRYRLRYAKALDANFKLIKEYDYGDSLPLATATAGSGEAASMKFVCSRR